MKLFLLLGNQLFSPKYLNDFKDHTFFMAEDYGLCTFEKHHKLKILLFLSSMRSFRDEIKSKNFNLIYKDVPIAEEFKFIEKRENHAKIRAKIVKSYFSLEYRVAVQNRKSFGLYRNPMSTKTRTQV